MNLLLSERVFFSITARQQGTVDDFLYEVDIDGSSLLHLAVNSGVLAVSMHLLDLSAVVRSTDSNVLACAVKSPNLKSLVSKHS